MSSLLVIVLGAVISSCFGANILFATEMLSPSHKIFNFALIEGLTKKGHNVTFLHPPVIMNLGKGLKNYHPIYFEDNMEEYPDMEPSEFATGSILDNMYMFFDYIKFCCNSAIESAGLQVILDYPKDFKFDLIIFDNTNSNCLLPLIQRFKYPPTIAITAFLLPYYYSLEFGNVLQPSYVPFFAVKYTDDMSFFERMTNYVYMNLDAFMRAVYVDAPIEQIVGEKFGPEMASVSALEDHVSLLLCNLDPAYHYPQPLTPNIIPVAGIHVRPAKPLPNDLRQIADNAKEGLILFALGTNIRSDKLGAEKIEAIIDALGKIKLDVIWKFESNLTEYSIPKNVHIRDWLPQSDILAHPNTKLFISHGGALSTIEAAYFGVPVLGIPFIVDQYLNVFMVEKKKFGLRLEYKDITSENLLAKMTEILQNPSYSKLMKTVSKRMGDQSQTPLERAIFWIEYVIRHNGTHFLNPRSRSMTRFVSTSADIQLTILFVTVVTILLIVKLCLFIIPSQKNIQKQKVN